MPTASTLPILLLVLILWRITRGEILSIVLFVSAFSAASALNLGKFGVEPWLLTLILCCIAKLVQGTPKPKLPPGMNTTALTLLILFVGYAVCSAVVSPFLFRGVTVVRSDTISHLSWGTSNLAQSFYSIAACLLYGITICRPLQELRHAVDWYIRACVAASCIAVYQLANAVLHIPYPSVVFYSNPSYVIYNAYQINGLWRLNGPFNEASEMAAFLVVGIALLGWELVTKPLRMVRVGCFGLMVAALMMTLSSLGYASLILMCPVGIAFCGKTVLKNGISRVRLIVALVLIGGAAGFFTLSKSGVQTVSKVLTSTLLDKTTSDSYKERTETHTYALQALADTAYVGAGWGSLRASGLGYILLGTVGIPGTVLFFGFYLSLFKPFFYRRTQGVRNGMKRWGDGEEMFAQSLFAATMLLCSMLIAGSEPVAPALWVLFGIATVAKPRLPELALAGELHVPNAGLDDGISLAANMTMNASRRWRSVESIGTSREIVVPE